MNGNGLWGNARLSNAKVGMILRLVLALLTTFGSIALAWTLLNPHEDAQATGIVEAATATYPWGLVQDGKHIWVAEPGCNLTPTCTSATQGTIGKYFLAQPSFGRVDFIEPSGYSSPAFVALDGQGNIWFTEPTTDAIGELTPTGSGIWNQWTAADNIGISAGTAPFDLTFDSNGNIWFTETNGNKIGFFDTTNHTAVETPVPTLNSQPYGIRAAPNGAIWFAESNARKLGTFTPSSNGTITISEYAIGFVRSHLLAFDQSGNVWYSEGHADAVGEYTPATKTTQNFSILSALCPTPVSTATPTTCGTNTSVAGIGIDSNGMVWFDETHTGSVGFVNPMSGQVTVITTVSGAFDGLIVDGSNNVWVSKLPHRLVEIPSGTPPATPTPTVARTSTVTPAPSPSVTSTAIATPSPTPCPSPSPIPTPLPSPAPSPTASPSPTMTVSPTASPSASPSPSPTASSPLTLTPTMSPSPCPSPNPSPSPSPTSIPSPTTTGPVSKTWYFAEGKVGAGFTEFLTLENPDTVNTCTVNIEYLLGTGSPVNVSATVAPATRFTESVNTDLNIQASSGNYQTSSAIVTVNSSLSPNCTGIVAERPMYFTNFIGVSSGSDVLGSTHTDTTFYFADVPTGGGYASFLTILNPGTTTAVVTATFVGGGITISSQTQTISVAGGTRGTIIPNNSGALLHAAVTVTSSQPVVVERPTYFSKVNGGNAQTVSGAASVVGVRTLKNDWLFAEGYTGGSFQEYFVLANFGTAAISVNVVLEFSNGHTETVPEAIQPSDQTFVNVNSIITNHLGTCDISPCQPTQDVSAEISSTSNFIAQREMFFHYNHVGNGRTLSAMGGTDVIGQSAAVSSYSFAEGYTNVGYDEWLTLQNPLTATETVILKIVNEDGRSFSQSYSLLAHSRFTIGITALVLQDLIMPNDTFKGYEVSLTTQTGSSALFMVERPMYWNTGSSGTQGGSDVIGYGGS